MKNLSRRNHLGRYNLSDENEIEQQFFNDVWKYYDGHPYPIYFKKGFLEGYMFTEKCWVNIWGGLEGLEYKYSAYYDTKEVLNQKFYTPKSISEWYS